MDRLPRWGGECVAIVASGASAKSENLLVLKNRIHVVAINTSWELVPFADLIYSCDANWWLMVRGCLKFKGLKVTQDALAVSAFPDLIKIDVAGAQDDLKLGRFGSVSAGGNSGFQALNLMAQMGVTGIMLIGFDVTGDHWHGRHPPPCNNPMESNFVRWRRAFNGASPILKKMGVDVVNCSPISTIAAYPKMTVAQALERWRL